MLRPFVAAAALVAVVVAGAARADAPVRALTVTGHGEARAAPDLARVTLGVSLRRSAAGEASAAAAAAMTAVLAAVRGAGVSDADLQTVELRLDPVWVWDDKVQKNRQEGYEARHMVQAVVRDLSALGPVLDAAAKAGATDMGGVGFDVADRAAAEDEARRLAVADAARVARLLAEAAGVTLGAPISISTGGGGWDVPVMLRAAPAPMADAAAAPPPVQAGELTFPASVSIVYAVE